MFDLRYHVASLAAVFFALVVGILVGVALASHGLGSAERRKLQDELNNAHSQIDNLRGTAQEYSADSAFVSSAYRSVMADRLRDERIALLFIGRVDKGVKTAVGTTLTDAGATLTRMRAISVPINAHAVSAAVARRSAVAAYAVGPKLFVNIGRGLGDEFVSGGKTPLWDALEGQLVEERIGGSGRPVDAVVLVRTVPPQSGRATAQLLGGLFSELADLSIPVVGAELRGAFPSAVPTYKHYGLSSVDDVDIKLGKVALAVLLSSDGISGHYGLQGSVDDAILPDISPVAPVTTTGG
jgi:Copper transport outer membrane protein, MctB